MKALIFDQCPRVYEVAKRFGALGNWGRFWARTVFVFGLERPGWKGEWEKTGGFFSVGLGPRMAFQENLKEFLSVILL
jgi:hypothetical protein